jgi:hypothetical protein
VRFFTFVGLLFFFGLRGWVYTDIFIYSDHFEEVGLLWDIKNIVPPFNRFEIGYVVFESLIKTSWNNFFFFVFISSLIDLLLVHYLFKRYCRYYVMAFLLFVVFEGVGMEFNLLRNMKAIGLFFLSLKYIQERKLLPFLLLNVLGLLFHWMTLFFIPLYFILYKQFSKRFYWIVFIVGNIFFLFDIHWIQPIATSVGNILGGVYLLKAIGYFETGQSLSFSLGYFIRFFTFVITMAFFNKLVASHQYYIIFINLLLLYLISRLFLTEIKPFAERMGHYFICSYWILYPTIYEFIKNRVNKQLLLSYLILYAFLASIHSNIASKYENQLFGISRREQRLQEVISGSEKLLNQEN